MTTTQDRVKAGAALLDKERPGWANEIDVAELRMHDCDQCILGQIYRRFSKGLDWFGITRDDAARNGFDILIIDSTKQREAYAELGRLWRAEIDARRNAATTEKTS